MAAPGYHPTCRVLSPHWLVPDLPVRSSGARQSSSPTHLHRTVEGVLTVLAGNEEMWIEEANRTH